MSARTRVELRVDTDAKPCPFCGGDVSVCSIGVMCTNCHASMTLDDVSYANDLVQTAKVVEAWNRRTGDTEALRKAARKLAWIHQQIDLYDDRQELHEEDYWMDYLTDPEWDDPDIEWKGEE